MCKPDRAGFKIIGVLLPADIHNLGDKNENKRAGLITYCEQLCDQIDCNLLG